VIATPKTAAATTMSAPPTANQAALGRFLTVAVGGAAYGEVYDEWGRYGMLTGAPCPIASTISVDPVGSGRIGR
jgi:hypothetical protein